MIAPNPVGAPGMVVRSCVTVNKVATGIARSSGRWGYPPTVAYMVAYTKIKVIVQTATTVTMAYAFTNELLLIFIVVESAPSGPFGSSELNRKPTAIPPVLTERPTVALVPTSWADT